MNLLKNRNSFENKIKAKLDAFESQPSSGLWDRLEADLPDDNLEINLKDKIYNYDELPNVSNWLEIEKSLPSYQNNRWFVYLTYVLLFTFFIGSITYYLNEFYPNTKLNKNNLSLNSNANKLPNENSKSETAAIKPALIYDEHYNAKSSLLSFNTSVKQKKFKINYSKKLHSTISGYNNYQELNKDINFNSESKLLTQNFSSLSITSENSRQVDISDLSQKQPKQNITPANEPILNDSKVILSVVDDTSEMIKSSIVQNKIIQSDSLVSNPMIYTTSADKSGLSFTVLSGVNYCFQTLNSPEYNASDFSRNISLRRQIESPTTEWSGAFLFDFKINNRWKFSSGICMTNFKQSVRFTITNPTSVLITKEPTAHYGNDNDSIIFGTTNNSFSNYSFVEIPFWVEYEWYKNRNLSVLIGAGPSLGILSGVNAQIVDRYNVGVINVNNKSDFPPFQNVFFFSLTPSIMYKLNEEVMIGISPSIKLSMNSMVQTPYWVQQYPYFVGINARLTRKF